MASYNYTWTTDGSTGQGNDKEEFTTEVSGYSLDQVGLDLCIENTSVESVVKILNKTREIKAVNEARVVHTAPKKKVDKNKVSVFDLIAAAKTTEEKLAIMKDNGLA